VEEEEWKREDQGVEDERRITREEQAEEEEEEWASSIQNSFFQDLDPGSVKTLPGCNFCLHLMS
jgi:hypothetical protein